MAFKKKEDWKEDLSEDAQKTLTELIEGTKKYRAAYNSADDAQIAQLWTALVEIKKGLDETNSLLKKVQEPFKAIVSVGEEEKRKTVERLITEIIKPSDEQTQEATKKLVESLMKF